MAKQATLRKKPDPIPRWTQWFNQRLPVNRFWQTQFVDYHVPDNLNFWYYFGILSIVIIGIQIVTGIFLAFHYVPDTAQAFDSVETIMREVPYGWLIRYAHSTGASLCFLVAYLHLFKAILYGSYRQPRELVWMIGVFLFLCLMAEAFVGYLLPWGQLSYWGAQVILNLFSAIPGIGESLATWIRGDFTVSSATLSRFFILHIVILPFTLIGLIFLHVIALRKVGSNNPEGADENEALENHTGNTIRHIPFFPYYVIKDLVAIVIFLMIFVAIICYAPDMYGYFLEAQNFLPMNPLQTPEEIRPLWYFMPFYAILRASAINFFWVDAKIWGAFLLVGSIGIWFLLPWLDRSPVRSIRYKGLLFKILLAIGVASFLALGYLGSLPASPLNTIACQIATVGYFLFFLLMPWYSRLGQPNHRLKDR